MGYRAVPVEWRAAAPLSTDHRAMAVLIESMVQQLHGDRCWTPPGLFEDILRGGLDWGPHPVVSYWGCQEAHADVCPACGETTSRLRQLERCAAMRLLTVVTLRGWDPAWLLFRRPPAAASPSSAYVLQPHDERAVAAAYDAFAAARVLQPVTPQQLQQHRKMGGPAASAFVVTTWAPQPGVSDEALRQWAAANPGEAVQAASSSRAPARPSRLFRAKQRVVYDLAAVNQATVSPPFHYPTLESWALRLPPNSDCVVLDVEAGYTAIPIAPSGAGLFTMIAQGRPAFRLLRMAFGYSPAGAIFCFFSGLLGAKIEAAFPAGHVVVYVDDVGLGGDTLGPRPSIVPKITQLFEDVGFRVSRKKTQGPQRVVQYLGMVIRCAPCGVYLECPQAKRTQLRWQLAAVLNRLGACSTIPKRVFAAVTGRLHGLSAVVPHAKQTLSLLYDTMRTHKYRVGPPGALVPVPPASHGALRTLLEALGGPLSTGPMRPLSPLSSRWRAALFGSCDASGEGGLGATVSRWAGPGERTDSAWYASMRIPGTAPGEELVGASTMLELYAIALAMAMARHVFPEPGPLLLCLAVDSQAAVALARRGYSKHSRELTRVCGVLERVSRVLDVHLAPRWIPRSLNWRADALSHPERVDSSTPAALGPPPGQPAELEASAGGSSAAERWHDVSLDVGPSGEAGAGTAWIHSAQLSVALHRHTLDKEADLLANDQGHPRVPDQQDSPT